MNEIQVTTFYFHLRTGFNVLGNKFHLCSIVILGDVSYGEDVGGFGSPNDVEFTALYGFAIKVPGARRSSREVNNKGSITSCSSFNISQGCFHSQCWFCKRRAKHKSEAREHCEELPSMVPTFRGRKRKLKITDRNSAPIEGNGHFACGRAAGFDFYRSRSVLLGYRDRACSCKGRMLGIFYLHSPRFIK